MTNYVTRDGWQVSTTTGSSIRGARLDVRRPRPVGDWPGRPPRRGDADGRLFPDPEAARAFAVLPAVFVQSGFKRIGYVNN